MSTIQFSGPLTSGFSSFSRLTKFAGEKAAPDRRASTVQTDVPSAQPVSLLPSLGSAADRTGKRFGWGALAVAAILSFVGGGGAASAVFLRGDDAKPTANYTQGQSPEAATAALQQAIKELPEKGIEVKTACDRHHQPGCWDTLQVSRDELNSLIKDFEERSYQVEGMDPVQIRKTLDDYQIDLGTAEDSYHGNWLQRNGQRAAIITLAGIIILAIAIPGGIIGMRFFVYPALDRRNRAIDQRLAEKDFENGLKLTALTSRAAEWKGQDIHGLLGHFPRRGGASGGNGSGSGKSDSDN